MPMIFGIDGGGTSTRLRIADEKNGEIWKDTKGAGINPNAVSPDVIAERLQSLFKESFDATGLSPGDFAAGCLGVAGADRSSERVELEKILRDRLGFICPLTIVSDPDITLVGGLQRLEGYLLIAGTGSIAVARLADGTRFRAGGLGHFLSDEGSAFFIGFRAIGRTLRSAEGRDLPTSMLDPLMERFKIEDVSEFVPFVYRRFDKARIAGAADLVENFRASGDALACDIMDEARDELVSLVVSVRSQVRDRIVDPSILLSGGLFDHNAWLKGSVLREIKATCPDLTPVAATESAVYGACMLALRLV